ncbi:Uma2 family endonuclease [Candidatus Parabeggiatoa sp. HSG14]|uniref:Uma2 family endonuclease n=1 Tax=Candidatus Parabeggiatoa sp. HSG14 TaxID=3055593 RepID=UPI0025A91D1B|nr:Uma2 family endonuclease [Thiotrichales bacterium HSG14]
MTTPYAIEVKAYQGGGTTHVPYAPPKKQVTEAEYWEKYYDYPNKNYEWNNGELEEKPVSEHVTYLTFVWFLKLVDHYLETHSNADLAGLEMGFHMVLPNKVSIRKPDFGIVLKSNPVPLLLHDSSYHGTFDMCIEAISESSAKEVTRDTLTKKAEYAQAGVKEYVILDGNGNHTAFYHLNTNGIYVPVKPSKGDIIKSKVLSGFQFRIADLYKKPSPEEMIDDSVYKGFVLPGYSEVKREVKEEKRARQEAEKQAQKEKWARQQAEQQTQIEQQARQQVEQQTKRLAKKLRELGINPDDI